MHAPTALRPATSKSRKAFWLKQLHMWHWMSSAVSLIGLLLFAVTGFTLNHAADIEATPVVTEVAATMPPAMLARLKAAAPAAEKAPLPPAVADWVEHSFPVKALGEAEWSAAEVYLAAPRPGGEAWVASESATGEATCENHTRRTIIKQKESHQR